MAIGPTGRSPNPHLPKGPDLSTVSTALARRSRAPRPERDQCSRHCHPKSFLRLVSRDTLRDKPPEIQEGSWELRSARVILVSRIVRPSRIGPATFGSIVGPLRFCSLWAHSGRNGPERAPTGPLTHHLPVLKGWPEQNITCFDLMYLESEAVIGTMLELMRVRGVPSSAFMTASSFPPHGPRMPVPF